MPQSRIRYRPQTALPKSQKIREVEIDGERRYYLADKMDDSSVLSGAAETSHRSSRKVSVPSPDENSVPPHHRKYRVRAVPDWPLKLRVSWTTTAVYTIERPAFETESYLVGLGASCHGSKRLFDITGAPHIENDILRDVEETDGCRAQFNIEDPRHKLRTPAVFISPLPPRRGHGPVFDDEDVIYEVSY